MFSQHTAAAIVGWGLALGTIIGAIAVAYIIGKERG